MLDDLKKDATARMHKCVQSFQADLKKLRTGRAHPSLVEHLKVDYYGSEVPLQQVANISVEDARTLVISPWEKSMVQAIEKAIHKSDLGLYADDRGHGDPRAAAAADRGAPPRHHQGACARTPRTRASASATCAATCSTDVKEVLKEKLISQDDERKAQDEIQKLTDRTSPRSTSCWRPRKRRSCRSRQDAPASLHARPMPPRHCRARGHRHGWQRPLGARAADASAATGTSPGLDPVRMVHRGVRAARHRGADAVRLLAARTGRGRPPKWRTSWACSAMPWTGELPMLQSNGVRLRFVGELARAGTARCASASPRPTAATAGQLPPASCRSP